LYNVCQYEHVVVDPFQTAPSPSAQPQFGLGRSTLRINTGPLTPPDNTFTMIRFIFFWTGLTSQSSGITCNLIVTV